MGFQAGYTGQGGNSIAIGEYAGTSNQTANSIAIGYQSGYISQGNNSIAIGSQAGYTGQGSNSIAIGRVAGFSYQTPNSIVLNASGVALNGNGATGGFYVRPVRNDVSSLPVVNYNTSTYEITYQTSSIRYKTNVIDLTQDTTVLHHVRAREYDSKEDNTHHIGYIAEELHEICPEFSWKNQEGQPEGVNWFNIMVFAIEEIKKLKQQNNTHQQQLSQIMEEIQFLKQQFFSQN
jgi:hypothetical protein